MPLTRCKINNINGWKWGKSGKCYTGKNAKANAIKQAIAIGKGKYSIDYLDSQESEEIFKTLLLQNRLEKRKKLKLNKKISKWAYPNQYERQYFNFLKTYVINRFVNITNNLLSSFEKWQIEYKGLTQDTLYNSEILGGDLLYKVLKVDGVIEEVELVKSNQYEYLQKQILEKDLDNFKAELFNIFVLVSIFNKNQFNKINKNIFGMEFNLFENWENVLTKAFVSRNVSLIKGLTDDYIKQIIDTIISAIQKGINIKEFQQELIKINKKLINRAKLIARDQINKINGQLTRQRQLDAGITTYIWRSSRDERVRPTHTIMEGRLCRWDDSTVYSKDNGRTWISRGGGVKLHPGEDIQCRCHASPNYNPLIQEVNINAENILG